MITRYVNTASTPGGTGTTNATTGENRAYASLQGGETAEQQVLSDTIEFICEGSSADSTANFDGWTTTAAYYILVRTTQPNRHDGKYDTSKYRLETSTTNVVRVWEQNIRFDGIQFYQMSSGQGLWLASSDTGNIDYRISHCLIRGDDGSTSDYRIGVYLEGSPVTGGYTRIWNNIIYDFIGNNPSICWGILEEEGDADKHYIYNNTIYNCGYGIYEDDSGLVLAKNNISYNNTDNYNGTFDASSTNNLSGPSQTDAPGSNPRNGVTVTFVNAGTRDLHLDDTDAGAQGYGANLYTDANIAVTDDIDGDPRPTSGAFDIGADQIPPTASYGKQFDKNFDKTLNGIMA